MSIYLTVLIATVVLIRSSRDEALAARAHLIIHLYKIVKLGVHFLVLYGTKYLIIDCGGKFAPTVPTYTFIEQAFQF